MFGRIKIAFVVCALSSFTPFDASSQEVPLSDGAYISKEHCEMAARGDLDMVSFMVEKGGRIISHEESYCVVSRVKKNGNNRFSVDSDCKEIDEVFQNSFFLDVISKEHIRVDGEDLWLCTKGFLAKVAASTPSDNTAEKKNDSVDQIIEAWADADENCAGGFGDDPATKKACTQRDQLLRQLNKEGMCFGKEGQSRSKYEWHKCTKKSLR